MRGKFLFIAGAAVGYVVGTRQGRQAYVKLKSRAEDLWNRPAVQNSVDSAREFVKENVPVVGEKVARAGKKAATTVAGKVSGSDPSDADASSSDAAGSNSSEPDVSASGSAGSDSGRGSVGRDA